MAAAGWYIGKRSPKAYYYTALICTILEFFLSVLQLFLPVRETVIPVVLDLGLHLTVDGFRHIYVIIIAFMWMMTMMLTRDYMGFSGAFHAEEEEHTAGEDRTSGNAETHHGPHPHTQRYFFFTLLTLSATMGVFLSADLFTALAFFEVMSFASFPWVIQEETEAAIRAANTYLAVAVLGGLAALMGLFLLQHELGTLQIDLLYERALVSERKGLLYTAGACILFGFGAKAGMFPVHIWLPKAHPVAPAPASALLSGVLTKSGIFGVIVLSCQLFRDDPVWGMLILSLGVVTMFLGALLALFSNNLKKTLACSSMSQIGFILTGIGTMGLLGRENALAGSGVLLHMVNHSLFKLVLFMCAGVVFMNTEALELNRIRGFGRKKPLLHVCFLLGAAGIGGIPGLSGYISKTLLHEGIVEAAVEYGFLLHVTEWVFLLSGGLTLAYMTKLYVCLFIEKGAYEERKRYMGPLSSIALLGSAIMIPVFGLFSHDVMDRIAAFGSGFSASEKLSHAVSYFSLENLKGAVISAAVGAIVYFGIVRRWMYRDGKYVERWPAYVDLEDRVYRPVLLQLLPGVFGRIAALFGENQWSGALAKKMLAIGGWAAGVFGENRITEPLARGIRRTGELVAHVFSDMTDGLVWVLQRTLFRPDHRNYEERSNHTYVYRIGLSIDQFREKRGKAKPGDISFAQLFERIRVSLEHATHNLTDTMSFALLMLCVAICAVMVYIFLIRN